MYGLFTYKLLDFYGKCRQIYHGVFGIVFLRMHSSLFPRIFVLFPFRQNLAHEFYSLRIPLGGSSHLVINNHGHRMSPKGCRTPKQNGRTSWWFYMGVITTYDCPGMILLEKDVASPPESSIPESSHRLHRQHCLVLQRGSLTGGVWNMSVCEQCLKLASGSLF